ncbi:MAG TPA: DASS family sodium-coupled anion symporter [Bacteroidales bacterium]|nr:DASS family sodium-coupled anion symporter [Bacteroidales bacterium]
MIKNKTNYRGILFFLLSLLLALLITWWVKEPAFTQAQTYVLFLLLFSVFLWLTEAVPPFAVGLFIMAYLAFTLGYERITNSPVDIAIYTGTFSSSVIWLTLGGFFLASALSKTRLDRDLIHFTLRACGRNPRWILLSLMLVTMVFSMLISNTATTAMVIAAVMPLLLKTGKQSPVSKGLVLGIPIAATVGGMGTIIGSPPNAIAVGALASAGHPMQFATWLLYGIPLAVLLTFVSWWVLVRIFMKKGEELAMEGPGQEESGSPVNLQRDRWIVIAVLAVTLLLWLTSPLHGLSAAAVSAIPLVVLPLTGILKGEDIRAVGWDTLLLIAGGLSLGLALKETGLLDLYAGRIATLKVSPVVFLFLLAYATMIFSNIMSNTATSTVLIPLGMTILPAHAVEVCMIIGLSASTALFLPVSTPPNAIAYSTGMIRQKDFRTGGALIGLLGPALIVLWVLLIT